MQFDTDLHCARCGKETERLPFIHQRGIGGIRDDHEAVLLRALDDPGVVRTSTAVLLVEDDERIASMLRRGLIFEGFDATVAHDGRAALDAALSGAGQAGRPYLVVFLTMRENRYASRVVEVTAEQQVIRSGPYAVVRHPMYLGMLLMVLFSALGLGSYWALIPAALLLPALVLRSRSEEKILAGGLKGYTEYKQQVRWRLVPGVW